MLPNLKSILAVLLFSTIAKASPGITQLKIYCYDGEPVPGEKATYFAEVYENEGSNARWINVGKVSTKNTDEKEFLFQEKIQDVKGTEDEGYVVYRIDVKSFTRLSINYPQGRKKLNILPSVLVIKDGQNYSKIPLTCAHLK